MWSNGTEVAAAADVVWELLTDVRRWPEWGPTVTDARLDVVGRRTTLEPDDTGRVRTAVRVWLPFTVTHWHDDGARRSWSWRVAGVPATSHEVVDLGDGSCRVAIGTPLWAPAYVPVVELGLRRIRALAEQQRFQGGPTAGGRRA
jgi:hypothetical protein